MLPGRFPSRCALRLREGDVKLPVQAASDGPMSAHGVQQDLWYRYGRRREEKRLGGDGAVDLARGLDPAKPLQPGEIMELRQSLGRNG